ncbi:MAG TPA: glycosyltransferase [Ilumatobacteraceae bacterium]|nr:glycosyltransferase [Ilumatobacteraceae bacterium]
MNAPVRVLHVAQPTHYGVARYLGDLAAGQVAAGLSVTVACPLDGSLASTVTDRGARHVAWEAHREPGRHLGAEVSRLRQVVAAERPDVVHLHSSKAGLVGRVAIRRSVPTIFQPHAWSFLAGPLPMRGLAVRWERHAARWCDAVVCGSRAEQRRGMQVGIDAPWHIVPNAIDVSRYDLAGPTERRSARRQLGIGDEPLVVCVGRLCRQKGQDVLLAAWPAVLQVIPTAQLILVGDGPDRPTIERCTVAGVRLVGEHDDVRPFLRAADVVVQPSRYETMALSMLEAMSMGRSVVATDIEGAREALGPRGGVVAGALVTPEDPHGLAVSIVRRLLDPELAHREGLAGRHRVEATHHRQAVTAGVGRVVVQLLTNGGAGHRARTTTTTTTRKRDD